MDHRSIQLFEEALKDGKETVHSIRVMVVGHIGVGKTTLVKRLLGKEVNISERCSTEGIDVYVNCCDVSLSTCEWTTRGKDSEQDYQLQRLARVLNEQQSVKDKVTAEEQLIIPPQGEITVKSHEEDRVAVEDKNTELPYRHSHHQDIDQDLSSTASQQGESLPTLVQRKLTQSENNTLAMLKLLHDNAYKIKQDTANTSPLTVLDFAGQFAFYTTHQTFLTRRAIYLLVSDVSEQLTDLVADECFFDSEGKMKCKVHDLLEVWLNLIHFCATSTEVGIPPVILVGTHVDQILQRYCHEICEGYFRAIRTYLSDKPTRFHLVDEDFAIDNTVVDIKLKDLKRKIIEVAKQQPYWGEQIPARWITLEQELMRLKAAGIKVLPRSIMDELNKACAVPIATDELDLFLRFHHDIGTILYFSIDILKEKIVLDPQWMIDALKSLITAEMFVLRSSPAVTDKWFEFKNKGKLSQELIEYKVDLSTVATVFFPFEDAVWTKEKHQDLHDNKEHILLLMEQLNIIAKLRIYSEEVSEIKVENCFLAPCMLNQKTPTDVIYPVPHSQMESSSVICYVFMGKYLPFPIFHRLLAACVARWPIATKMNNGTLENLIFCGCCVFQLDHYHKLTIYFRDYIIFMRVTRKGIADKTPSSKLCIEVREVVSATLIKIIGCLGQSLKFEQFIQCPEYNGDSGNSLIPVSLLQEKAEVCCACHDNIIESNKLLQFWFDDKGSQGENAGNTANTDINDQILPQVHDVRARTMNIPSKLYHSKGVPCSDPTLLCQILNKSTQASSSCKSTLEENCLSVGLELHAVTPADGNCFFEAISSQLQRLNCVVQHSPQQLRQDIVAFMRTNRVLQAPEGTIHLDSFIYDETFEDYCTRMARDREWADHVVVVAMARKLQMDIMIVMSSPSAGPEDIIVWVVGQTDFHGKPILLGHIWESHYLSLQPIGVNKNKAGLMKAETDQTEAVFVHKLLVQQAMSVGIIRSPNICGTGFRVGSCYIMTAKHVIDKIMDAAAVPVGQQMKLPHPLSNRDVFIDFSYEMDARTSNENLSFHFEPTIIYGNDELDTVILQLKHDNTKKYPPPLTKFTQPPKNESHGYFIGHSKGEIKKTDKYKCVTLNPHEIAAAREWSMKRVNVDGFVGIDDSRRVLLHCSFEKGASGSPGFWIDPSSGQACVLLMLLCGYPDWYYDENYKDKTIGMLPKDLIEQGVYMTAIYDDLNKRNTVLCQEIFNCHCNDVEMA